MVLDIHWKRLACPLPFANRGSGDDDDDEGNDLEAGIAGGVKGKRQRSSHCRLAETMINLSILKLDGSSFDVQIGRMASVGQLKMAIEKFFNQSFDNPDDEISWFLVWSHFCLCYNDHKLTDDKAYLASFQIKDGDQLKFIRHPVYHKESNHRPRVCGENIEHDIKSSTVSLVLEGVEKNVNDKDAGDIDNGKPVDSYKFYELEDADEVEQLQLSHRFRRWFCYSKQNTSRKNGWSSTIQRCDEKQDVHNY